MADKPHITPEAYVTRLVQVGVWATPQNPIQYAFLQQHPAYLPNEPGWTVLSAAQRAAVVRAFAMIAEVVNLTFVQVPDNQQQPGPNNPRINFYANSVDLSYSGSMDPYQFAGSSAIHGADIRFNTARIAQRQSNEHFQDFTSFVALHEVLHAVGLSHPGNYNGQGFNYQDHAEFVEDTIQYSVMSYFSAAQTGADHFIGSILYAARTPLLYDILALQSLYSPNMTTRAGDTIYGFNSNTGADSPFNFQVTTGPVVAIWDGGGIDTIDLSGYSDASLINLNQGEFSDAGGLTKNISIAFGVTIENALGGTGDDVIRGNAAANRLEGGAGNDLLDGGEGADLLIGGLGADLLIGGAGNSDYAVYSGKRADYVIDTIGPITVRDTNPGDGDDGTDTIEGVEFIQFADAIVQMGVDPNNPPVLGDPDMIDQVWPDGVAASYVIPDTSFIDLDGQQTLSYTAVLADGAPLPSWLNFDSATRRFSGTPPVGAIGAVLDVRVTASDGKASVSDNVLISVSQAPGATVWGTTNNDVLSGTFRDEILFGDDGDDILRGSPGADRMDGHAGTDGVDYSLSPQGVIVDLTSYDIPGQGGDAQGDRYVSIENATGSAYADVITGNDSANTLDGKAGADTMAGGLGDDVYFVDTIGDIAVEGAGAGIDTVHADVSFVLGDNLENLVLLAGALNGTGNGLANSITGNGADNILDGKAGADVMAGGLGHDTYHVDDAGDVIVEAGGGNDSVLAAMTYVLPDNVEYITLTGTDMISATGNALNNIINGNNSANFLVGGLGADFMTGGGGDDTYFVDNASDEVFEFAGGGTDTVSSSVNWALGSEVERLILTGTFEINGTGNAYDNVITGNDAANRLDGGIGADTMLGGLGNDTYVVDNAGDVAIDNGGLDTVLSSVTIILHDSIDDLILTGTGAINGTGNGLWNVMTGNAAANTLDGGVGNDILNGGLGADTLIGGAGHDTYYVDNVGDQVIDTGGGNDHVHSSIDYVLGADLEYLTLTGTAVSGTGNAENNLLYGNASNNILDGKLGADHMVGGLGDDIYYVENGGDEITEHVNEGTDTVMSSVHHALIGNIENLTLIGTSQVSATGNELNNVIIGNSANNVISGGLGADTLSGGGGNDVYQYRFVTESTAPSKDMINGFNAGDKINLSILDANTNTAANNDAFTFIGSNAFHNIAGELRATQSGGVWTIQADVNGDGVADLTIGLTTEGGYLIGAGDFIL